MSTTAEREVVQGYCST